MADKESSVVAQRAAYAEYVRLQWRLIRLPAHDPTREALAAEVATANRRWRALAGVPDTRGGATQRSVVRPPVQLC